MTPSEGVTAAACVLIAEEVENRLLCLSIAGCTCLSCSCLQAQGRGRWHPCIPMTTLCCLPAADYQHGVG